MVWGMYTYRFVTFSTNLQLDQIGTPYLYDLGISGKGIWPLKPSRLHLKCFVVVTSCPQNETQRLPWESCGCPVITSGAQSAPGDL